MPLSAKASNLSVGIQRRNRCEDPFLPFVDLCGIATKIFMKMPSDQLDSRRYPISRLDRRGRIRYLNEKTIASNIRAAPAMFRDLGIN